MSHVPSAPPQYVCEECRVVHAGERQPPERDADYAPPTECSVCGHAVFERLPETH